MLHGWKMFDRPKGQPGLTLFTSSQASIEGGKYDVCAHLLSSILTGVNLSSSPRGESRYGRHQTPDAISCFRLFPQQARPPRQWESSENPASIVVCIAHVGNYYPAGMTTGPFPCFPGPFRQFPYPQSSLVGSFDWDQGGSRRKKKQKEKDNLVSRRG